MQRNRWISDTLRAAALGCALGACALGTPADINQTSSAVVAAGNNCPAGNGFFVLYYGTSQTDFQTIRDAQPNFVVLADLETRSDIVQFFHAGGVKVICYIATGYAHNSIDGNISNAMQSGFDGVFFDETDSTADSYNAHVASLVHQAGASKLAIMNPGSHTVDPDIFNYADIVSSENDYNLTLSPSGIAPWRWLSVQGDPASATATSAANAISRLQTYRGLGGFWYYSSTDHTWTLPTWFNDFATQAKALPMPCTAAPVPAPPAPTPTPTPTPTPPATSNSSVNLVVQSIDDDHGGAAFSGMWTEVFSNGSAIVTGWTPLNVTSLAQGTYTVTMGNYQNYIFRDWDNGSTSPSRTLTLTSNTTIDAHYHSSITLTVSTQGVAGDQITGLYNVLKDSSGNTVGTGFSPTSYTLTSGASYTITTENYGSDVFEHWDNGSTTAARPITASASASFVATYAE